MANSILSRKGLAVIVGGVVLTGSAIDSNALSVAYVNINGGSLNYLSSYGHTVSYLNNPVGLTVGDLSGYDVVVAAANNAAFKENANIGNVLADFADAGGGVVLTEFVFQGWMQLGGRIMTTGYSPFTVDPLTSGYVIHAGFGTIHDSTSTLLDGALGATTAYQANVGLDGGATLVADWANGRHALAYTQLAESAIVGLNTFPADYYSTAETERLVANAVLFSVQDAPFARNALDAQNVPDGGPGAVAVIALLGMFAAKRRQKRN